MQNFGFTGRLADPTIRKEVKEVGLLCSGENEVDCTNRRNRMEMITMLQGDCMDLMRDKPDKFWDLAIVDPPYGINAPNMQMGSAPNRSGKGQYPGTTTAVRLKKGRLNAGSGKLKDRILNTSDCGWDFEKPNPEYFGELFRVSKNQIIWGGNYFLLPPSRGMICWDKLQPWDNFSQFELAWTSFDKPARMFRYSNTGGANIEKKSTPPKNLFLYIHGFS
jgi:site-specific DNA-methyltransferase (adenine-specific)